MTIPPPFNSGFPLAPNPFRSRIQTQIENVKNYYAIAFKPGYPLQASELNEMQEIFYTQQTLTQTMMNTWLSYDVLSSLGGLSVLGPGWEGCTPLFPTLITHTTGGPLVCNIGWYLVKNKEINGGIGVWVYKDTITTISSPINGIYNLVVNPKVIHCTTLNPEPTNTDNSLQDQTAINVVNGPCGAARLKLIVNDFATSAASGQLLSPILTMTSNIAAYKNNYRITL